MSTQLKEDFFFTKTKNIITELARRKLIKDGSDLSPFDVFEKSTAVLPSGPCITLSTRLGRLSLCLPCVPKEASSSEAIIEIEEKYLISDSSLKEYRYAVTWRIDSDLQLNKKKTEYIDEVMAFIKLKRSIRFDFHPEKISEIHHPIHHWHPNGVSEVCLPTPPMTPFALAAFAIRCFDNDYYKTNHKAFGSDEEKLVDHFFTIR